MGRRDSSDEKWIETKEKARLRDHGHCRLLRVTNAHDGALLKKKAGSRLQKIDCAHIFPVSMYPELVYEVSNVVQLNRYSHEMLDSSKDPIHGASIEKEAVYEWWEKIAGPKQWSTLMNILKVGGREHGREEDSVS